MDASRNATLAGLLAILLWSSLALLTVATDGLPPFQVLAIAFAALLVMAAGFTYGVYVKKAGSGARFPLPEVLSALVAAAAWGLAMPESPILATVHDAGRGALLVGLIALVGIAINTWLSSMLQSRAT